MKERPILFSAPMVRALLDGSKQQTRRIVKPQPQHPLFARHHMLAADDEGVELFLHSSTLHAAVRCPFGPPGDRLWVREGLHHVPGGSWWYRADDAPVELPHDDPRVPEMVAWAHHKTTDYCPSIHMPRWASRINLEITGVRVERLQDISSDDAYAEGAALWAAENAERLLGDGMKYRNIVEAYRGLWESINGAGSWDANPWVWVVEFKSGISQLEPLTK